MCAQVLVVEDNQANLELMVYLLTAFGHSTITANDGGDGIAAACRLSPDLILCDLQLPGIDGFEVVRELKGDPEWRAVPIVAVTASAMASDKENVLSAGFDGYITKPIDPETFVSDIEAFLMRAEPGLERPPSAAE